MTDVASRLAAVNGRIREFEARYGRAPGSVRLLAVSKTKPAEDVAAAFAAGQRAFGENHLQDALGKLDHPALAGLALEWHFIGPLQSNKTRPVAERFQWVHSLDRLKVARRLSEQRPAGLGPLDVCIQLNISAQASKSGIDEGDLAAFADAVADLPRLRLRGLMAIPAPAEGLDAQRAPFRRLREAAERLRDAGHAVDTLSMGMTDDMEAAVAEGSTLVRIGTAIFGPRPTPAG